MFTHLVFCAKPTFIRSERLRLRFAISYCLVPLKVKSLHYVVHAIFSSAIGLPSEVLALILKIIKRNLLQLLDRLDPYLVRKTFILGNYIVFVVKHLDEFCVEQPEDERVLNDGAETTGGCVELRFLVEVDLEFVTVLVKGLY